MKARIIHFQNLSSECWYVQAWGAEILPEVLSKKQQEVRREKNNRNRPKHFGQKDSH